MTSLTARRAAPDRPGLTFLESLAAVSVLAIMTGMVAAKVDVESMRSTAGVRLIREALHEGQRVAVAKRGDVIVSFDLGQNRMRIAEDTNRNQVVDRGETSTWYPLEQGVHFATPPAPLDGGAPQPISGNALRMISGYPSVIFNASGAASSALALYVTSARARRGDARALRMAQASGRTDWYRYTGAVWSRGGS